MTPPREAGFTLMEVLVTLVVLGLLISTLALGVNFGLHSWAAQGRTISRRGDLEAVDRALRHLIEHMDPGGFASPSTVDGGAHALAFTTELPGAATWLRTRQADVALGVDARHRLVLHWTPHLPGVSAADSPPATTELLRGVERLDIGYWQEGGPAGGTWVQTWHAETLPTLVRIHVVFVAGDRRRWPDLVARPMLARPVVLLAPVQTSQPA